MYVHLCAKTVHIVDFDMGHSLIETSTSLSFTPSLSSNPSNRRPKSQRRAASSGERTRLEGGDFGRQRRKRLQIEPMEARWQRR